MCGGLFESENEKMLNTKGKRVQYRTSNGVFFLKYEYNLSSS